MNSRRFETIKQVFVWLCLVAIMVMPLATAAQTKKCTSRNVRGKFKKLEHADGVTKLSDGNEVVTFVYTNRLVKDKNGTYWKKYRDKELNGHYRMDRGGFYICETKKRILEPQFRSIGRFNSWKNPSTFIVADYDNNKSLLTLLPKSRSYELTPLPNLKTYWNIGAKGEYNYYLALITNPETGRDDAVFVDGNFNIRNSYPNAAFFGYNELAGTNRTNNEYLRRIGDRYILKTQNEHGPLYLFTNKYGQPLSPMLPELLEIEYFDRPMYTKYQFKTWLAIKLEESRDLYLPVNISGGLKPAREYDLLGYQPLYIENFKPIESTIKMMWPKVHQNTKVSSNIPVMAAWIKVYDVNGTQQYGYAKADLSFETGPIWKGNPLQKEWSGGNFNNAAWTENSVSVYGPACILPHKYVRNRKKHNLSVNIIYAQLLDGSWMAYDIYGDKFVPLFTKTYSTKNAVYNAITNYIKIQRETLEKDRDQAIVRLERIDAERAAYQKQMFQENKKRWESLYASGDLNNWNELYSLSRSLGGDRLARFCIKFGGCNMLTLSDAKSNLKFNTSMYRTISDMMYNLSESNRVQLDEARRLRQAPANTMSWYDYMGGGKASIASKSEQTPSGTAAEERRKQEEHFNREMKQYWEDVRKWGRGKIKPYKKD